MLLTEAYLRNILRSRREVLIDEAIIISCKEENKADSIYKEIDIIDRILNKEESIQLDLSAYKYFDGILKIN